MKQIEKTLTCLLCASAVVFSLSINMASGQADYGDTESPSDILESPTLNLFTLNVAHGRGTALNQLLVSSAAHRKNLQDIASLLLTSGAQVAALQEADAPSLWSGRFDHVEFLAGETNYPFYTHGSHADSWLFTYGAALISSFRMSDSASHSFRPSWPTAGKGFVRGTLMWHSGDPTQAPRPVTLVSVHLDFSRESVRETQIAELVTELSDVGTALIIMGDFNADWSVETSPVRVLANGLGLRAFEPTRDGLGTYKRNERLDWILISSELRFIDYAVLPSVVSDHLAVVASIGWGALHEENRVSFYFGFGLLIILAGCATPGPDDACTAHRQDLPECPPPEAIEDPFIDALYLRRTWVSAEDHQVDVVDIGVALDIPEQNARTKFLGARSEDALNSLAAKIWMIENARHTIDATYYIFKRDLIGEAMLGALCNAVKRGVDIRFMVDSIGSIDSTHSGLKALETCADEAGYMRSADGKLTTKKARIQVVIFNAVSNVFVRLNRRSHDKLLVVDGRFPELAMVMTGGRNVSLSYYGIKADGSPNPDTYMDAEILLRTSAELDADPYPLGSLAENYYTILFLFDDNKRLSPSRTAEALGIYESKQLMAQEALATLKALPSVKAQLDAMPTYLEQGWYEAKVLLAHELDNLTNEKLFSGAVENMDNNDNSIQYLLRQIPGRRYKQRRIVSPYLFAAQYYDEEGNIVVDGARNLHVWLEQHPEASLEIITNSVLTSDNFSAQAVIDMNMAPRLLLTPELQEAWLESHDDSEMSPDLVESEEWIKLVNHPRLKIYETGRLDDRLLGGDVDYGKLHAKYIVMDDVGFVGTTNFDDRSGLINNEMGFFFASEEMADDLHADFELLKSRSYLWGSPEWLEFRRQVFELDGLKGNTAKSQRAVYKTLRAVGLDRQL